VRQEPLIAAAHTGTRRSATKAASEVHPRPDGRCCAGGHQPGKHRCKEIAAFVRRSEVQADRGCAEACWWTHARTQERRGAEVAQGKTSARALVIWRFGWDRSENAVERGKVAGIRRARERVLLCAAGRRWPLMLLGLLGFGAWEMTKNRRRKKPGAAACAAQEPRGTTWSSRGQASAAGGYEGPRPPVEKRGDCPAKEPAGPDRPRPIPRKPPGGAQTCNRAPRARRPATPSRSKLGEPDPAPQDARQVSRLDRVKLHVRLQRPGQAFDGRRPGQRTTCSSLKRAPVRNQVAVHQPVLHRCPAGGVVTKGRPDPALPAPLRRAAAGAVHVINAPSRRASAGGPASYSARL